MKKAIYLTVFFLLTIELISCSTKQGVIKSKSGDYQCTIVKSDQSEMPTIYGTVYDYDTKKPLKTNGAVKIKNNVMAKTDVFGNFLFKVEPGKYFFTIAGFPYKFLSTKHIRANYGDSIKINVYLKLNDEPIID